MSESLKLGSSPAGRLKIWVEGPSGSGKKMRGNSMRDVEKIIQALDKAFSGNTRDLERLGLDPAYASSYQVGVLDANGDQWMEESGEMVKEAGYTLHQRNPTMSRHPLDKGGKMKGYIAFYKGKKMEVKAISALSAREIAAEKFRARKPYDVEVVLAEKGGKQVTHMPMFASEETPMTLAHILESEGLKTAARPRPEFTVQGYKGFTDQIRDLDVLHTEAMELKAEIDAAVAPLLERKGKLDKEMKKIHTIIKEDYKESLDKIGKITIERKTQLVEAQAELSVVARKGTLNQVNAKLLDAVAAEYGDEVAAFIKTTQAALQDSNKTMAISFKGFEIERKADVKAASEKSAGLADLLSKFQDYLRKSWKRVVAVAKNALGMVESASDKVEKAHGNLEKALAQVDKGGRMAMDLTARSGLGRGEIKNLTYRVLLPALNDAGKSGPEMGYILIEAGELFNKEARAMFGPPSGKVGGSKGSDRSTLIRMASELPKGSDERRAILAGLKSAGRSITVQMYSGETMELTPTREKVDREIIYEDDEMGDLWVFDGSKLAPTDGDSIDWRESVDAWEV